jgi:hypothetical protein
MVRHGHFFLLHEEDALVRFCPNTVQVPDEFPPSHGSIDASLVKVIDRIGAHHLRCKALFVSARNLQISVSAASLKKKPVSRIRRALQQPIDSYVQFGDVKLGHCYPVIRLSLPAAATQTTTHPVLSA